MLQPTTRSTRPATSAQRAACNVPEWFGYPFTLPAALHHTSNGYPPTGFNRLRCERPSKTPGREQVRPAKVYSDAGSFTSHRTADPEDLLNGCERLPEGSRQRSAPSQTTDQTETRQHTHAGSDEMADFEMWRGDSIKTGDVKRRMDPRQVFVAVIKENRTLVFQRTRNRPSGGARSALSAHIPEWISWALCKEFCWLKLERKMATARNGIL